MKSFLIILALGFSSQLSFASSGKIAVVQYTANEHFGDYQENQKNLLAFAEEAVSKGAGIIAFPEGSTWGYETSNGVTWCHPQKTNHWCRNVEPNLEAVPNGPTTDYWTRFSKKHGVYVIFFVIEKENSQIFRTAVVAGPNGFLGKYRKRHLWDNEKYLKASTGNEPLVLETPWGKFGILICFDIWFRHVEEYQRMGVDAILLLSDWAGEPAQPAFKDFARKYRIDFFATDDRFTDGTGFYPARKGILIRNGIPKNGDGVSLHDLSY